MTKAEFEKLLQGLSAADLTIDYESTGIVELLDHYIKETSTEERRKSLMTTKELMIKYQMEVEYHRGGCGIPH